MKVDSEIAFLFYEGDGAWTECTDGGPVKCEVGSGTEGRPASFMKDTVLWKV